MRCIKLLIAYDGTLYCGWQRQLNDLTIQGVLEDCLEVMTQDKVTVQGAGRTDAGVHAKGMVASFTTNSKIDSLSFHKGLNSLLPEDIRIISVEDVDAGFHARYNSVGKQYCYQFSCNTVILPTLRLYVAHYPGFFDEITAQKCLDLLIGEHDFSSFEAVGSRDKEYSKGRGAVRHIYSCTLDKSTQNGIYSLCIRGDGFLRHMVRNIAGTVIETAQQKRTLDDFARIMTAKDRSLAGATAPANGLILQEVFY